MSRRLNVALAAAGLSVLTGLGCANTPTSPDLIVDPIQIEKVEVRVMESSPPQAAAHVEGILGDGCSELHSQAQTRSGSTVTITLLRERPRDAVCSQIAKLYVADIPLEGQYPPGRYVVRVNDVVKDFTTE